MTDTLELLFGTKEKARLIRFFILNKETLFSFDEVISKNKIRKNESRKALRVLVKMKLIVERSIKKQKFYVLNKAFPYYPELHTLIAATNRHPQCEGLKKIRQIGDVKLVLLSGIFLDYAKGKIDMLLVVNNIQRTKLAQIIAQVEAEVGREIRYMLLDAEEFRYRLELTDRFLTDFFEGPNEELVNRIPNLKRFISILKK